VVKQAIPHRCDKEQSQEKVTTRRASNKGCLSMTLDQYLKLLDWT